MPSSATVTSATRWPAASRSCCPTGTVRPHRHRDLPEEDRGRHHQPDRRHVGPDLGHRVPARRRDRRRRETSSTPERSSRCCAPPIEGIKARGGAEARRQDAARRARPGDRRDRGTGRGRSFARPMRCRPLPLPLGRPPRRPDRCWPSAAAPRYTGERSIGTLDAGAVAVAVLSRSAGRPTGQ